MFVFLSLFIEIASPRAASQFCRHIRLQTPGTAVLQRHPRIFLRSSASIPCFILLFYFTVLFYFFLRYILCCLTVHLIQNILDSDAVHGCVHGIDESILSRLRNFCCSTLCFSLCHYHIISAYCLQFAVFIIYFLLKYTVLLFFVQNAQL